MQQISETHKTVAARHGRSDRGNPHWTGGLAVALSIRYDQLQLGTNYTFIEISPLNLAVSFLDCISCVCLAVRFGKQKLIKVYSKYLRANCKRT